MKLWLSLVNLFDERQFWSMLVAQNAVGTLWCIIISLHL